MLGIKLRNNSRRRSRSDDVHVYKGLAGPEVINNKFKPCVYRHKHTFDASLLYATFEFKRVWLLLIENAVTVTYLRFSPCHMGYMLPANLKLQASSRGRTTFRVCKVSHRGRESKTTLKYHVSLPSLTVHSGHTVISAASFCQ